MDFGNSRQQASRAFWDSINRNKMGNADQMWDGMMDVASARAQALGLAPIRPTAAQEATADAARLKRARDYWRNPGPKLGPFPAGDQVVQRERIPGGPISTLPADQAMDRLKGPPRLQPGVGLSPSNDADYEALLTRARNGYYLDGRERQALVGRFGAQLGSLLDSPAEGAAMRPREFKQRADRLKMMAALGIGTNGGAPGAPIAGGASGGVPGAGGIPAMPVSTAGAPGAMPNAVPAMPAAGASGGAMPTAGVPSGVPLPGYQGMQQATPLDTMLSGKPYLQNRAQIGRAARDYRRSGFNPQMAALLAQEQQAGNRGFMAQSELMNRGMANEANAQTMGYNQGLGDLNIKDRTRQDMVNAAGREADFRDQEYKDRMAMVDRLLGGDGSTNPQAGMTGGIRDALRNIRISSNGWIVQDGPVNPQAGPASPPAGPASPPTGSVSPQPGTSLSPTQKTALLMDLINQGSGGKALDYDAAIRRVEAERDAARYGAIGAGADPNKLQPSGGASPVGGVDMASIPSPKQDESGKPVINRQYIEGVLRAIPQGSPKSQIDKVLSQAGITVDDLSREYSAVSPGRFGIVPTWGEIARPYTGGMGGNFLLPGWRAMFRLGRDPQYIDAMAAQEDSYRKELMRALGIGGGQPTNTTPSFTPR